MVSSSTVQSFPSQLSDYLSNQISEAAPVSRSPDTVVYSTSAVSSSSSTFKGGSNAFPSQLSQYLSSQLSENSPLSTSADTVVFINTASSSSQASSPSSPSFSVSTGSTSTSTTSPLSSTQSTSGTSSFLSPSESSSTLSSLPAPSLSTSASTTASIRLRAAPAPAPLQVVPRLQVLSRLSYYEARLPQAPPSQQPPTPLRNSGKRGLAYNQANLTLPFSLSGQKSRVSWAYNWFYQPPPLQHIPLLYPNAPDLLTAWPTAAQAAISSDASALMSFNEPDVCFFGCACMSITDSITTYQQYMQPFAGQTRLGAPFGLTRLTDSLANCTGCTADFINIHWYSNKVAGAEYFKSFVDEATAVARGKPIWITEFGLNNENPYAAAELQRVLQEVLPWLDQQVDVELYGVFYGCAGHFVACGGSGLSGAGLGVVYNNFTGGMGESLF